jgi:hypothetical protein
LYIPYRIGAFSRRYGKLSGYNGNVALIIIIIIILIIKGEVTKVFILPVIIGALGTMTNNVQNNLDKLKIGSNAGDLQKIGLLGTARILRKVLDS